MLYRAAILLAGLGFVAYRVLLTREIRRARRSGDVARERRLRSRGFGLHRWLLGTAVVLIAVFSLLVWRNGG
jgi:hypothetical protein